jgi:hypothetical protein
MPQAAAIMAVISVVSAAASAAQQIKTLIDSFSNSASNYDDSTQPEDKALDDFIYDLNRNVLPDAKNTLAEVGIKMEARDWIDSGDELRELKQLFQNMLSHAQEIGLSQADVDSINKIMGSLDRAAAYLDSKGQVHDVHGNDGGRAVTMSPMKDHALPTWLQQTPGTTVVT